MNITSRCELKLPKFAWIAKIPYVAWEEFSVYTDMISKHLQLLLDLVLHCTKAKIKKAAGRSFERMRYKIYRKTISLQPRSKCIRPVANFHYLDLRKVVYALRFPDFLEQTLQTPH